MLDIPKTADRLRQMAFVSKTDVVPADNNAVGTISARLRQGKQIKKPDRPWLWTMAIIVGLPVLISALYYSFIATDQYAAKAQFSVRSSDSQPADILGSLTGMVGTGSANPDSYIVANYIISRELVEDLDKKVDLRAIYSRPEADFYARFDPSETVEGLVEYFGGMVTVNYDSFTGITELEVRAFRPDDAQLVADRILGMSEQLVNDISRKARNDAVRDSEAEVSRSENRLRLARSSIVKFRNEQTTLDPGAVAANKQTIIVELESARAKYQTELNGLLATMSESAPRVIDTKRKLAAVEKQIIDEQTRLALKSGKSGEALADVLSTYEELLVDREFAEKAYLQSLAALEGARMQATRQQRYIATFVKPRLPEESEYPEGIRWVLVIFVVSFLIWGIYSLVFTSIRDRMA